MPEAGGKLTPKAVMEIRQGVSKYDGEKALRVLEAVSEGNTLAQILKEVGISKRTWYRWVSENTELQKAWNRARAMSSFSLEDDALGAAKDLLENADGATPASVAALRAAMDQLRWSAARRNPSDFGDKTTVNVKVPIQINTSLNLGSEDTISGGQDIYHVETTAIPKVEFQDGEFHPVSDQTPREGEASRGEGGGEHAHIHGEAQGREGQRGSGSEAGPKVGKNARRKVSLAKRRQPVQEGE